jgi:hypothetical protein
VGTGGTIAAAACEATSKEPMQKHSLRRMIVIIAGYARASQVR